MKLIIGLGNPGDQYTNSRHNLGFLMLDEYAKKYSRENLVWQTDKKFQAQILKINPNLWLVKPQTFMNNSGMTVSKLASYYRVDTKDLIIVHDDLDLKLGKVKVRLGGAAGGHHGVESVIGNLGTDQFIRLRLGLGNEKSHSGEHQRVHFNAEKFVLEKFKSSEKSSLKHMLKQALHALETLVEEGLEEAQNQYN